MALLFNSCVLICPDPKKIHLHLPSRFLYLLGMPKKILLICSYYLFLFDNKFILAKIPKTCQLVYHYVNYMSYLTDNLKNNYTAVLQSDTDKAFYKSADRYLDFIVKTLVLAEILDKSENEYKQKHTEIWSVKKSYN